MRKISNKAGLTLRVTLILVLTLIMTVYSSPEPQAYGEKINILAEESVTAQDINNAPPWEVDQIDANVVYVQSKGEGVKIAILDTGIDLDHPDLKVAGNVTFVKDTTSGDDDNGHGTMIAGIIAALDNTIGVTGIVPEAEIYAVKILNQDGKGSYSDFLKGIEWAIDNDMQIINMSFGAPSALPIAIQEVLIKAYEAGIVLIASNGNDENQVIAFSPARYESVIAVGATNQKSIRTTSLCNHQSIELLAPGTGILSTNKDGKYNVGSGSSYAAAYVSATAAQIIASGTTSNVSVRTALQGI